jgi:signal transduction histidine kinase
MDDESPARLSQLVFVHVNEVRHRQERQRFLATVAHDLRAPLAGLTGLLDLLQAGTDGPLQPQQEARLRRIRSSVDRLTAVAAEISDLAMAEAGRLSLARAAVSLGDALSLAREDIEPLLRSRAVDLQVSLPPDLPRVHGDPERVRQILRSLLSRSVMRAEGAVVEVNATHLGGVIELTLQESPRSLPVEALPPGFTTPEEAADSSEPVLAEGLALSLARRLVELHGGAIRIGNGGDGRLLAHLRLPAYLADSRRPADRSKQMHPSA